MKLAFAGVFLAAAAILVVSHAFSANRLSTSMAAIPAVPKKNGGVITNIQWTDCDGTGQPYLTLNNLILTGDIEQFGFLEIIGQSTCNQAFSLQKIDYKATCGSNYWTGDLKWKEPLNLVPGPYNLTTEQPFFDQPVSGQYKITARLRDPSGNELQCFFISFQLSN